MLAVGGGALSDLDGWRLEPKYDGWRAVLTVHQGRSTVRTRTGRDITGAVPELHQPPPTVCADVVLDGELVVGSGLADDFYRLGPRLARSRGGGPTVTFMAFDVLQIAGREVCSLGYDARRSILLSLGLSHGSWQTVPHFDCDVTALLAACEEHGLEGLVAKRATGRYRPGRRSSDWRKVKTPTWRTLHAPRRHA